MILAFARVLKRHDINYQNSLLVEAGDISETCAYMTYIQLSLYGIPAIVKCGNVLTTKLSFQMETPFFYRNYFKFRKFFMTNVKEEHEEANATMDIPMENKKILKEVTVKGNCQISLW